MALLKLRTMECLPTLILIYDQGEIIWFRSYQLKKGPKGFSGKDSP